MTEANNNRLVLLLIAGIPLTMILAATWLWYFVVNGELDLIGALGTSNQGTLVQPPRQIDDVSLFEGAAPSPYAELEPRWSLLVPWSGEHCDADCERSLYVTRQIHVATGKYFNRIRRLYVSDHAVADIALAVDQLSDERPAPASLHDYLDAEQKGLTAMQLSSDDFQGLFPEWDGDRSTWYLVDPGGWIMMSYTGEDSYKEVISDLKFLLKNSGG